MANGRQQQAPEQGTRRGQEGSRWYNERPTGEQIASWFKENVKLDHEDLKHEDYVTGITLIPGEEKSKEVVGYHGNGAANIQERTNLAYTPYPRVDTRVKYFHDLMRAMRDEWVGFIEPVDVPTPSSVNLPPGFFYMTVKEDNGTAIFLCCSMKVTVYEKDGLEYVQRTKRDGSLEVTRVGKTVIDAPPGTKMVPVRKRYADPNSVMKAETGAIGRALGLAGMLIVPGAGVATAEDMGEALDLEARPAQATPDAPASLPGAPEPPPAEGKQPTDDELRVEAASYIEELQLHFPEALVEFRAWAKEKNFGKLSEVTSPALRGVVRKLEAMVNDARKEAGVEEPTPDDAEALGS